MQPIPRRPDLSKVQTLFARFESEDRRRLAIFVETVSKVGRSKLLGLADQLGDPPRLKIHHRAEPGRRGEGTITTRVANPDVREAAWPALRKLRTEANSCSTTAARNVLHQRARQAQKSSPNDVAVAEMVTWLKAFKQTLHGLESSDALVIAAVRDAGGSERLYRSRKQVLDLAQAADTFHDNLGKRDDFDLVRAVLEPALDHALIAHARLAFELADVAEAVLAEPALLLR